MTTFRVLVKGIKTERATIGVTSKLKYKDRECLNVVITNLLICVRNNDMLLYSRDNERADSWKNNPLGLSNYRIMKAIDWLEQERYVFNTKASAYQLYDDTRQTSYVMVTHKFIDKFYSEDLEEKANKSALETVPVLSLRTGDKKEKVFRFTKDVVEKEQAMRCMNLNNAQFDVTDEHGNLLNTLYARVYKEDWALNGRMYSPGIMSVENRESKGRLRFNIEEQDVVETDYNAIHVRIFADMNGAVIDSGDVYMNILPADKRTKENRTVIKGAVNRMLNCESHASALATVRKLMSKTAGHTLDSYAQVLQMIYAYLGDDLKEKLYSDRLGLRLANIESNIMSDVVKVFVLLGKPILPVHDSAIVLRADKELLAKTMADCYRKHLGVDRLVEMKYNEWIDGKEVKENCSY
jgi:hypothetical protein